MVRFIRLQKIMDKDIKKMVIQDSKDIKNVFIQVDMKKQTTSVLSNFSAWENLAYIMEGLAVTAQKCLKDGMSRKKVYGGIKKYLLQALSGYDEIIREGNLGDRF